MSCSIDKSKEILKKKGIIDEFHNLVAEDSKTISELNKYTGELKTLVFKKFGSLPEGVTKPIFLVGKKVNFNDSFFKWVDKKARENKPLRKPNQKVSRYSKSYYNGDTNLFSQEVKQDFIEDEKEKAIDDGKLLPVATNSEFRTIDWGKLKGKPLSETKPIQKDYLENHILEPIKGTDKSIMDNLNRIIPAYKNLLETAPANTVLITHSNVIKLIEAWKANGSKDDNSIDVATYLKESPETGEVITEQGKNGPIYIVRHGNTVDGDKGLERTDDTPLNEQGVQVAKDAAKELSKLLGGHTPNFISSDLSRAIETSDIITEELAKIEAEKNIPTELKEETKEDKEIAKLTKVEESSLTKQERFAKELEKWLYAKDITPSEQINIVNSISGVTFGLLSDANLKKNSVQILDKGTLLTKQIYQDRLKEINQKETEGLATPEDLNAKKNLEKILDPKTWEKIQTQVIRELIAFGYKFKNGKVEGANEGLQETTVEEADSELNPNLPLEDDIDANDDFLETESLDGRGDNFNEMSWLTSRMKDTMSSHLKVWLSSVSSMENSIIPVGDKSNTFVGIDTLINNIDEATVGLRDPLEMINALNLAATKIPTRGFLKEVADKLRSERDKGTKIANEFFVKFNDARRDLVMVKMTSTPRKIGEGDDAIYETDEAGDLVYDIHNQVININRNDIPRNLIENWNIEFGLFNKEQGDEGITVDKSTYEHISNEYTAFKKDVLKYFDSKTGKLNSEEFRPAIREKIKDIFSTIGVSLSTPTVDALIDGKIGNQDFTEFGAFQKSWGIFSTIFSNFNPIVADSEQAFDSTGMKRLAYEEANHSEYFMNTSSIDGKGRNIWMYGLHNPLTREFWKLIGSATGDKTYVNTLLGFHYNSQSDILKALSELGGEQLNTFLNSFGYAIYNVTRTAIKNSEAKELKNMNENEFVISQIQLFTNEKKSALNKKWSYKFLTTPSDKTTMPIIKTPDHDVRVDIKGETTTVLPQTVNKFYEKFLGEYKRIKAYLDGDDNYKAAWDKITTAEPKAFYSFAQFNVKSKYLWKQGSNGLTIRDLDEEIDGISASTYVKDKIKEQVEQDIAQTGKDWEDYQLLEDGKLKTGFNPAYTKYAGGVISLSGELEKIDKRVKEISENQTFTDEKKDELIADLMEHRTSVRNQSDKNLTKYLIADFAINYQLHNMEMHMLFLGDPSGFLKSAKNKLSRDEFENGSMDFYTKWANAIRDNLSKRMAGINAPGTEGSGGANPFEDIGVLTLQDGEFPSKILEDIRKFDAEGAKNFEKTGTMDGQELITPEEDLRAKFEYGKLDRGEVGKLDEYTYNSILEKIGRQHEDIEKQGFISDENLFTPEEGLIAQAQKPVVFANIPDTYLKASKTTYFKSSALALYPQFTQGFEIDKLRQSIYTHNKSNPKIDRLIMASAAKEGSLSPTQGVFNPDMSINAGALQNIPAGNIDRIPKEYFRIQMEVPFKPDEDIRIFTQHEIMAFAEALDLNFDTSSIPNIGKKNMTGKELKAYRDSKINDLLDIHEDQLHDDMGIFPDDLGHYSYDDLSKLKETLTYQALSLGYSPNEIDGLELADDKKSFKIPIGFSNNPDKYEKLLLSMIDKTIKRRMNGRSFILATEQGMKLQKNPTIVEGSNAQDLINYHRTNIVFTDSYNPEVGLLPQRPDPKDKNKTLPAQIMVGWHFKDNKGNPLDINDFTKGEPGHKTLDLSKCSPEILKVIGIKIPLQGHATTADIEMVGFLPSIMGNAVFAPQDFTKQMGTDFDIDKLNSYIYNTDYSDGKLKKFEYSEAAANVDRRALAKKSLAPENKLLATIFDHYAEDILDEGRTEEEKKYKAIRDKRVKDIHNELQDIYHVITSHPEIYRKMLEGVNEGVLQEVAERLRAANPKSDTQLPSMSSNRYKVEEYFDNAAGKLGIAVFNNWNTFFSIIEGNNIEISRPLTKKEKEAIPQQKILSGDYDQLKPLPFILKDPSGKVRKLSGLAMHNGWNKLVSIWQSASVDNAKLKLLGSINVNKYTMGVVGLMSGITNNAIKANGIPVYNEEYITTFINQPSVKYYIQELKNAETDPQIKFQPKWKQSIQEGIKQRYINQLEGISEGLSNEPIQAYSQEELWNGIEGKGERQFRLKLQLDALNEFIRFESMSAEISAIRTNMTMISKGTPSNIQEALFKKAKYENLMNSAQPSKQLSNITSIFEDKDGNPTLIQRFYRMGVELPIKLFKGDNVNISPILPYATDGYQGYLSEFRNVQNKGQEGYYNAKFLSTMWNSFLSYQWTYPSFNIADGSIVAEREKLITDKITYNDKGEVKSIDNKSLATEIKEFKNSDQYKENPILKPLMNSLKPRVADKRNKNIKFVEFSSTIGLVNPETEVILALEHLRNINYPLFEKIVKYSLIVPTAKSPKSIRRFIANYYLDAIGITDELRAKNNSLNSDIQREDISYAPGLTAPLSQLTLQTFQHNPELAMFFKGKNVKFDNKKTRTSFKISQKDEKTQKFWQSNKDDVWVPLEIVSTYDFKKFSRRLYRLTDWAVGENDSIASYHEIDRLGHPSLSEFNADATGKDAIPSIIKGNKALEPFPSKEPIKLEAQPLKALEVKDLAPNIQNTNHLTAKYGYDEKKTDEENVRSILTKISKKPENAAFREVANILLAVDKGQGTLSTIKLKLGDSNHYDVSTKTVNLDMTSSPENFEKTLDYNALHEILHHFTISKMTDGSEISKVVNKAIDDMIAEMEKPENLQKVINELKLDTTPEALLEKLAKLRAEQNTASADSGIKFESEEERSILNPLINKFEFVASIMNDKGTQRAFSKVNYKESKSSFWSRFLDMLRGLFNNLKRILKLKVNDTLLNEGLGKVAEILSKEEGKEGENKPEPGEQGTLFKLTPIKNESEKEEKKTAEEFAKRKNIEGLKQRKESLSNQINRINQNPDLTKEQKKELTEPLFKNINQVEKNITTLATAFNIENLVNIGNSQLDDAENIINSVNSNSDQIIEAISTVQGYVYLYKDINRNKDFSETINPELLQEIENLQQRAATLFEKTVNAAFRDFVPVAKDVLGKPEIDKQELTTNYTDPNLLSSSTLNILHSSKIPQADGMILYTELQKADNHIKLMEDETKKALERFKDVGDGDSFFREYETKDSDGLPLKQKDYKTRNAPKYYQTISQIWSNWDYNGGNLKSSSFFPFLNNQTRRNTYTADLRYLYPEEFNQEMGKNMVTEDHKATYIQNITKLLKEMHSEFGDSFGEHQTQELLKEAENDFNRYKEHKDREFKIIDEIDELGEAEKSTLRSDWLAQYSPFPRLNELYELSPESMFKESQVAHAKSRPTVSWFKNKEGQPMEVPISTKDPVTGKKEKFRHSDDYIIQRPRRKFLDNSLTGFVDDEFLGKVAEYVEKVVPEIANGVPEEQQTPTWYGALNYYRRRQQEIMKFAPYYVRKDVPYWRQLDIKKTSKEMFNDAKFFYKFILAPKLAYDSVVNAYSKPHLEKAVNDMDLVTERERSRINPPHILQNKLNTQGMGDFKTNDLEHYFSSMTRAFLQYHYKTNIEAKVRMAEFLFNHGGLTDRDGLPFQSTNERNRMQWTNDKLLFGDKGDLRFTDSTTEKRLDKIAGWKNPMKLTQDERNTVNRILDQIEQLEAKKAKELSGANNNEIDMAKVDSLDEKIASKKEALETIKRIVTTGTRIEAFNSYMRLVYLGFKPIGRLVHVSQNTMALGNMALDGRVINFKNLGVGLTRGIATYGLDFLGATSMMYAVMKGLATHQPELMAKWAEIGAGLMGLNHLINTKIYSFKDSKLQAKMNQLMHIHGLLERADLSEENFKKMIVGKVKYLTPYGLIEGASLFMEANTLSSLMDAYNIKDLTGKERALWDAYTLDEDDNLVWNEKEFGTAESNGFARIGENSKNFVKFRALLDGMRNTTNGDFSPFTTQITQKSITAKNLVVLRKWMVERINAMGGAKEYNPLLQMDMEGSLRGGVPAIAEIVKNFFKKEDEKKPMSDSRKAAAKVGVLTMATWLLIGIMGMMLTAKTKAIKGGLTEEDDPNSESDLASPDISDLMVASNMLSRIGGEEFNPFTTLQSMRKTDAIKGIHPGVGMLINLGDAAFGLGKDFKTVAIGDDYSGEAFRRADRMSHRELISNRILKPQDPLGNWPVINPKTGEEKMHFEYPKNTEGKKSKYPSAQDDPDVSRFLNKMQKMLPFLEGVQATKNAQNSNNLEK